MDPGVHVYRNRFSFQWEKLVGAEYLTTVLPQGRMVRDEFGINPDGNGRIEVYDDSVRVLATMRSTGKQGDSITIVGKLGFAGCSDEVCYPPGAASIDFVVVTAAPLPGQEKIPVTEEKQEKPTPAVVPSGEVVEEAPPEKKRGALWLVLMAFAAGIGISFTPCVYPMIPITAAIVGGARQKGKLGALLSSMVYVLGLSITYSVLGLLVASGGARVRAVLTSPWVLVPIAGIFVFLALSMFDLISIQVQPKAATRLQSMLSGEGHVFAIFALGIVSGLVAGPCLTAPLAGILVIVAREANRLLGFSMLFALAWGMGIVLIVAGTFAGALPKAGEWMLWVKRLLGFILLWAAAYFVSPVIGSTAYRVATAGILLAGAVFLGGFDALTKESGFGDRAKRFLGLVAVLAAFYLVLGSVTKTERSRPLDIIPTGNYQQVQEAIASGQPVVLDFYLKACKPCKDLDEKTFSDPRVVAALQRFHAFKVNVAKEPRLVDQFNVLGAPTLVFIGSNGKEIEDLRFSGFRNAEEFLETLEKVK
jgi:thiol:disulfide interchange protein DsbD